MGYDTIYAVQDIEDDEVVGIGSTARFFGERTRTAVAVLYAAAILLVGGAIATAGAGLSSWAGLAVFAVHLANQVRQVDLADGAGALRLFRSNRDAGLLLFAGLAVDALTR
jgi:4-hydroxybenzoate polyprenyltransferase